MQMSSTFNLSLSYFSILFFLVLLISCYFVCCVILIFRIGRSPKKGSCLFRFCIRFAAIDSDQHICPVINALRPPSDFLKEAAW